MATFGQRIVGAVKLDVNIYEEVEADSTAFGQAMGVVVLSSLAAGIGATGRGGSPGLLLGTIAALIGWFIWAWLTYFIGTRILPTPQTEADRRSGRGSRSALPRYRPSHPARSAGARRPGPG